MADFTEMQTDRVEDDATQSWEEIREPLPALGLFLSIAEHDETADRVNVRYEKLNKDNPDIFLPLALPQIVSLALISILRDDNLMKKMLRIFQKSSEPDPIETVEIVNEIIDRIGFILCPVEPVYEEEDDPECLFMTMANYVLLWYALWNHVTYGDRSTNIMLPSMIDLKNDPPSIDHLIITIWLARAAETITNTIDDLWELADDDDLAMEEMPTCKHIHPILSLDAGEDWWNHIEGWHALVSPEDDSDYKLTCEIARDGVPMFVFEPQREGLDDSKYKEMLLSRLMNLEMEIMELVQGVEGAWQKMLRRPEIKVRENEAGFLDWWREALTHCKRIFLESDALTRALAVLNINVCSERIEDQHRKFRTAWRKHLPDGLTMQLKGASAEIAELFRAVAHVEGARKNETAMEYYRAQGERFNVLKPEDVADLRFDGENAQRDMRRMILPRVARRAGKDVSAKQIEALLKKGK